MLLTGIVVISGAVATARADHFAIDLEVKAAKVSKTARTDTVAVGVKPKPRGILEAQAGKTIEAKWTITSTAGKDTAKDVLVHFFVVKIDKAGQQTVPKLDKDVPAESALTMDFKPKDKAEGELSFTIDKPGTYLIRLETIGSAGKDGHEHFAALDLVIK
jgi:hypothetical protein